MRKIVVGVLRGGSSGEYEISLKTGQAVLKNLPESYAGKDILITKNGQWHVDGLTTNPAAAVRKVDVIFNAMHGRFGEDGKVQQILEHLKIPYTGSGPLASALAMNKILTKEHFVEHGIKTPRVIILDNGDPFDLASQIFKKMSPPWVVKPAASGSSLGLSLVRHLKDLPTAIIKAFEHGRQALVEEFIRGKEAACGVIDKFRGREHYALFPIEVVPPKENFFSDCACEYSSAPQEICPAVSFTEVQKKAIEDMSVRIHQMLNLRHYSRSDFVVSPRGIYALEANALPGLAAESLLPKSIEAIGSSYGEFLDHIINLALTGV